jgi:outer membrane protein OmpA-like peptidoglycan-associated protein
MRVFILAAALLTAGGPAALAQSPSAADLINSLKPTAKQLTGATRGIRPAKTTPLAGTPDVQQATVRAETAPVESSGGPGGNGVAAANLVVEFKSGSAVLTPAAERTLSVLGHALTSSDLSSFKFRIEGHTDTVGNPDTNRSLSQQRADAVVSFLEQKFGMSSDKLQAVGVGSDQLLVPTPENTPEPRNRAVKIVNLGA